MIPGPYKIDLYQGEDWSETWQWSAGDPAVPVLLTGYTFRMDWRSPAGTLLVQFGPSFPGTFTVTAATGNFNPSLASAFTALLPAGVFSWDVVGISPGGVQTPLLAGQGIVTPRVTVP